MAHIVITAPADADSAYIINDLDEKAGWTVADRYEADFDKIYDRLEMFPQSGAPRPALGRHVRICVVSPYVILYEYLEADDAVMVLRLVHGRRRITRKTVRGG